MSRLELDLVLVGLQPALRARRHCPLSARDRSRHVGGNAEPRDEHIPQPIHVAANEVAGERREGNVAAIGADPRDHARRLASSPSAETLTRDVAPVRRSWTNTSETPFRSSGTRLDARDVNAA